MDLIVLDGSYGEGGGQIVRTAVGLSAYLGVPCRVERIRRGRPNPGLRAQHVAGIKALLKICRGEAEGLRVGSESLTFRPGPLRGGTFEVDVGTAGAIGLVLQTLLLPASRVPARLRLLIRGGTDVAWAPTIGYVERVLLPLLRRMGYRGRVELKRRGYYPKGGGEVLFEAEGGRLRGLEVERPGEVLRVEGISHAAKALAARRVAERQREAVLATLRKEGINAEIRVRYEDTPSPGSGVDLWAICKGSVMGANALGERGKRAEEVGREAAESLLRQLSSGAALDEWMADQIVPFLAVAEGPSAVSLPHPTGHLETNLWVVRHFPVPRELSLLNEEGRWILTAK
ncbi:MAG: RNA 3'-phosphate cyclase [Deltaproteobacteria bacterium]|nr:MAG: RNA 3'-phosphate cyclase [Deltaproteobacteria bacterium]